MCEYDPIKKRKREVVEIWENLCKEHESATFVAVSVTTAAVPANKKHLEHTTE